MTYSSGLLRFEATERLEMLRSLVGLATTYGSTEMWPTLKVGKHGLPLKRGIGLIVVKVKENSPFCDELKNNESTFISPSSMFVSLWGTIRFTMTLINKAS